MADEAVAELVEGVTGITCDPPVERVVGLFTLPVPGVTLLERGEKKGRWLECYVESGSLCLGEALWQTYEWCEKEMLGESRRAAACAAEHDGALLHVRALRAKVGALSEGVAERDVALLEVGVLRAKVADLDVGLAVARKEAVAAKSEIEYCRLAGQVHEGTSKLAGKLAEKLSREKQLLQKEVE